jgi:hypothetical protein
MKKIVNEWGELLVLFGLIIALGGILFPPLVCIGFPIILVVLGIALFGKDD